jgi:ATP-dependent Clp protease adaptor protein ClpS
MSEQSTAVAEPEIDEEPPVETRTQRKQKTDADKKSKPQRPYAVIVHNDEDHTWQYVIEVLQRVCGHNIEKAFELTSQVHFKGKAVVWTGPLEVAELKRDQIRGFGPDFHAEQTVRYPLGVTIEQMPG